MSCCSSLKVLRQISRKDFHIFSKYALLRIALDRFIGCKENHKTKEGDFVEIDKGNFIHVLVCTDVDLPTSTYIRRRSRNIANAVTGQPPATLAEYCFDKREHGH